MSTGKIVPGVYVNDAGEKRVMTKKQFKRKQNLRGSSKGAKPTRWRHLRVAKKTK